MFSVNMLSVMVVDRSVSLCVGRAFALLLQKRKHPPLKQPYIGLVFMLETVTNEHEVASPLPK